MSLAAIVLIAFAAESAAPHLPIDFDRLPPGAKARLGSTRYSTGMWIPNYIQSLSPDGKRIAVMPGALRVHDAETVTVHGVGSGVGMCDGAGVPFRAA